MNSALVKPYFTFTDNCRRKMDMKGFFRIFKDTIFKKYYYARLLYKHPANHLHFCLNLPK